MIRFEYTDRRGAVDLSKNNAGVLRLAQRGQKARVEQKDKSWLDLDVQYA